MKSSSLFSSVLITDTVDAVDDLSQFLAGPLPQLPNSSKKIEKRRSTVCVAESKRAAHDASAPVDKVSRVERSSVSADPNNQTKSVKRTEEQAPIRTLTPTDDGGKKLSSWFSIEISFQWFYF